MDPIIRFIISSGSKEKESRYECLIKGQDLTVTKCGLRFPPLLHSLLVGLLLNPITCRCLPRELRPVRRSVRILGCELLKDSNWVFMGSLRERDHWGDAGSDGRIILRWIFRKWDVGVWTGSS
jgi:hypothetical protein